MAAPRADRPRATSRATSCAPTATTTTTRPTRSCASNARPSRRGPGSPGLLDHVTTAEPWTEGKPRDDAERRGHRGRAAGARRLREGRRQLLGGVPRGHVVSARKRLGDVGAERRRRTGSTGLGTGDAHVLLTINAQETDDHQRALGKMRAAMDDAGGTADRLPGGHRAADGRARALRLRRRLRPAGDRGLQRREGARRRRARRRTAAGARWRPASSSSAIPTRTRAWTPSAACPARPPDPLGKSGTYMVWRKLYQDVALWRRVHARRGEALPGRRRAQARGEGRRALAERHAARHAPRQARPRTSTPPRAGANDFRYDDDLDGMRCPLGAHIRRSNPRDALGLRGRR